MTEEPDVSTDQPSEGAVAPPRPERRPERRTFHGRVLVDDYAWLRDPDDPSTIPHLEAENAWTERVTAPLAPLRAEIFEEIRRRTQEDDTSVPVRDGDWWYQRRTGTGLSYPIHVRRRDDGTGTAPTGPEQVVLDPNELVTDGSYLGIGVLDVSPDGNWLAYALDFDGDEHHDLRFRDLRTGQDSTESIGGVSYGFAWAADSGTCWYTLQDDAYRPNRVLRHVVGTDPADDVEVFRDEDERFHVSVAPSRSRAVVVVSSDSAVTSESWLLDAHDPSTEPVVVAPREHGVEYSVAHHPTGLMVVSNHAGAVDFALWRAPVDGTTTSPRADWECVLPHRPGTRIVGVDAFARHLVVHGRKDGRTALWRVDPVTGTSGLLHFDEDVATVGPGDNPSFDVDVYRLTYQSLTTPPSVFDEDLVTGERVLRKQLPVLDGFDASAYSSALEWAEAADGTKVPISIV
ncbi:MAG: S9 family peptidase, partial [Acidimicrobiales bacterium]|nr:S9 family peptidase [Acidimicrobiales bacterium]